MASLGQAFIRIRPDAAGFSGELESGVGGAIKKLAVVAAGVEIGKKLAEGIDKSVDKFKELGGQVSGLKRIAGGSVEEVSRLRFAAGEAGVNSQVLGVGLRTLSRSLATVSPPAADVATAVTRVAGAVTQTSKATRDAHGNITRMTTVVKDTRGEFEKTTTTITDAHGRVVKSTEAIGKAVDHASHEVRKAQTESGAAKVFRQLGIDAFDAHGKMLGMADLLPEIAEKFKALPDGAEKTADALKLFGRQGTAMLPFLNKGKEGIKELEKESDKLGLTLNKKDLDAIKKNTIAHRELHAASEGLSIQVGRVFLPIMANLATFAADVLLPVVENVVTAMRDVLTPVFDVLGGVVTDFTEGFDAGTKKLEDGASVFAKLGGYVSDAFGKIKEYGGKIKTALHDLFTSFKTGFTNPFAFLKGGGVLKDVQRFGQDVGKVFDTAKADVGKFFAYVKNPGATNFDSGWLGALEGAATKIAPAFQTAKDDVGKVFSYFQSPGATNFDAGPIGALEKAASGIKPAFETAKTDVGLVLSTILGQKIDTTSLTTTFSGVGTAIGDGLGKAKVDLAPFFAKLSADAKSYSQGVIDGVTTGIATGNFGPLGKAFGAHLGDVLLAAVEGLTGLGKIAESLSGKLFDAVKDIDFVGLGLKAGALVVPFVIGLVAGIGNALFSLNTLKQVFNHLPEVLIGIVSLIPIGRLAGPLGALLEHIPILRLLAPLLRGLEGAGGLVERALGTLLRPLGRIGAAFLRGLGEAFGGGAIGRIIGRVITEFRILPTRLGVLFLDAVALVGRFFARMGTSLESGAASVGRGIGGVVSSMLRPFARLGSALFGLAVDALRFLLRGVGAGLRPVLAFFEGIDRAILGRLTGFGSWLLDVGVGILRGLGRGVSTGFQFVRTQFAGIKSTVLGLLGDAGTWLYDVGKSILQGLLNGIKGALGLVGDALGGVKDSVVGGVKHLFGINSPSRVTHELGAFVGQGFANGIADQAGTVRKSLAGLAVLPAATRIPQPRTPAPAGAHGPAHGHAATVKHSYHFGPIHGLTLPQVQRAAEQKLRLANLGGAS